MKTLKRFTAVMVIMSFIAFQGYSQNVTATNTQKNLQDQQTKAKVVPGRFVDKDKDGVCDNHEDRIKNEHGANFIDKNGDGICDNRQNAGEGKGNPNGCGMGYQHRHGQFQGNCCGRGTGYHYRHGCRTQNSQAPAPPKSDDKNK